VARQKIVVITGEVLAERVAGPAIRAREIARALASCHDVALVTTDRCDLTEHALSCRHADGRGLEELAREADVVVLQGDALRRAPGLRESAAVIVVDLYDPFHLEVLERTRGRDVAHRRALVGHSLDVMNEQLRRGDFFLCASPRQRDLWIGHLTAVGRVNEVTYEHTRDLGELIAVVPFGTDDTPPQRTGRGVRGVVPGIGTDDELVFWGGGIYDWYDPLTLVHAIARLRGGRPRLRLFFAGVRHPNPAVGETSMAVATRALSDRLGLTGTHVFFHEWIEYSERANYLLDADLAVSTHFDHVETQYSFRTRVLDYLWAGLPVVTTAGDSLADAVVSGNAGVAVPPEDVDALAVAIDRMLGDQAARKAAGAASRVLGATYRWPLVLAPIVEFCAQPRRSPDLLELATSRAIFRGHDLTPGAGAKRIRAAAGHVRRGEWKVLWSKVARRLRRGA
jgi:glycosyltransferase involved in cell wall biosynthesis